MSNQTKTYRNVPGTELVYNGQSNIGVIYYGKKMTYQDVDEYLWDVFYQLKCVDDEFDWEETEAGFQMWINSEATTMIPEYLCDCYDLDPRDIGLC